MKMPNVRHGGGFKTLPKSSFQRNFGTHFNKLRFKYTTKFSLPKIACPAIVYAEIVVVIDPFFVGVCPWIKVYRYNPTEICQQRLQVVRNVAQKLCSWERSFTVSLNRNYCDKQLYLVFLPAIISEYFTIQARLYIFRRSMCNPV